jgi:uncharacterized alkaline shock family protein YloU
MTDESNVLGRIIVSPKAIATIASQSALQSYGVVGMASKNIVDGIAQALVRDPRHGVQVSKSPLICLSSLNIKPGYLPSLRVSPTSYTTR